MDEKYCPDCGTVLLNSKGCGCGWVPKSEPNNIPQECMVAGCNEEGTIAIHTAGGAVTRCARCWCEELERANRHQLRGVVASNYDQFNYILEKPVEERAAWLRKIIRRAVKKIPSTEQNAANDDDFSEG